MSSRVARSLTAASHVSVAGAARDRDKVRAGPKRTASARGTAKSTRPARQTTCRRIGPASVPPGLTPHEASVTVSFVTAGWSSPVARWAHNPKVVGSNPTPATNRSKELDRGWLRPPPSTLRELSESRSSGAVLGHQGASRRQRVHVQDHLLRRDAKVIL